MSAPENQERTGAGFVTYAQFLQEEEEDANTQVKQKPPRRSPRKLSSTGSSTGPSFGSDYRGGSGSGGQASKRLDFTTGGGGSGDGGAKRKGKKRSQVDTDVDCICGNPPFSLTPVPCAGKGCDTQVHEKCHREFDYCCVVCHCELSRPTKKSRKASGLS